MPYHIQYILHVYQKTRGDDNAWLLQAPRGYELREVSEGWANSLESLNNAHLSTQVPREPSSTGTMNYPRPSRRVDFEICREVGMLF